MFPGAAKFKPCALYERCQPFGNLRGRVERLWQSALGSYWHLVPWKPGLPKTCKALGNAAGCVLHPPARSTAPRRARLRASVHQGSLSPRLSSSLQGKTGGRIPMSVSVQAGGWRAQPGPQAQGQKARSRCRRFHDPRRHSQPCRPGPALAACASRLAPRRTACVPRS